MSSFNPQAPTPNPTNTQPSYQRQYPQPNSNQSYQNIRNPPQQNYAYPPQQQYQQYPRQQYPAQQQYQQGYQPPQEYSMQQNSGQGQYSPDMNQQPYSSQTQQPYSSQTQQPYSQTQLPNVQQPNSSLVPPPVIPPNSPLLRHQLSTIIGMIKKNLQQFSPQFQQRLEQNQSFKSLNRKLVFIPSFLIMGHVLLNRNKKWFRLTVNAKGIRYTLVSLLLLHLSTNVLYVGAYRDMIARNRDRIEKIVVREEFIGTSDSTGSRVV